MAFTLKHQHNIKRPRMTDVVVFPSTPTSSDTVIVTPTPSSTTTTTTETIVTPAIPLGLPSTVTSQTVVTTAPTPPPDSVGISSFDVLLDTVARDVDMKSIAALYQSLVATRNALQMQVYIIGDPLDVPLGSTVPLAYRAFAVPPILATWDGKTMSVIDYTNGIGGVGVGGTLTSTATSYRTLNIGFGAFKNWLMTFRPLAGGAFRVSAPLIQDVQLSLPATAAVIALFWGTPAIFSSWAEAE